MEPITVAGLALALSAIGLATLGAAVRAQAKRIRELEQSITALSMTLLGDQPQQRAPTDAEPDWRHNILG